MRNTICAAIFDFLWHFLAVVAVPSFFLLFFEEEKKTPTIQLPSKTFPTFN